MLRVNARGAVAASLLMSLFLANPLLAQNGSNYHVLTNGGDALFAGIGAGGTQTAADGLGTYIAGEDLRGSHLTSLGDFGYRMPSFTENACPLNAPSAGPLSLKFPAIIFVELD